jgi:hypothetical protein
MGHTVPDGAIAVLCRLASGFKLTRFRDPELCVSVFGRFPGCVECSFLSVAVNSPEEIVDFHYVAQNRFRIGKTGGDSDSSRAGCPP